MGRYGARNQVYKKPFSIKDVKKSKKSLYVPFSVLRPRKGDGLKKDKLKYGIISHKKPVYDYYVAEFDDATKREPHVHFWSASQEGARFSDTRSEGVSLLSGNDFGIVTTGAEERDKYRLKEIEKEELAEFIDEHRKEFFVIFYAHAQGIKLEYATFNEEVLKMQFDEKTWKNIEREFAKFASQKYFE